MRLSASTLTNPAGLSVGELQRVLCGAMRPGRVRQRTALNVTKDMRTHGTLPRSSEPREMGILQSGSSPSRALHSGCRLILGSSAIPTVYLQILRVESLMAPCYRTAGYGTHAEPNPLSLLGMNIYIYTHMCTRTHTYGPS